MVVFIDKFDPQSVRVDTFYHHIIFISIVTFVTESFITLLVASYNYLFL